MCPNHFFLESNAERNFFFWEKNEMKKYYGSMVIFMEVERTFFLRSLLKILYMD